VAVIATVRGLSTYYKDDGVERLEIRVQKPLPPELPVAEGQRATVSLVIGGNSYEAGINAPPDNDYAWISPDLIDATGHGVKLARVLGSAGIEKNQQVALDVNSKTLTLRVDGV